ncbi:cysteine synthase A [Clostridium cylindrosporum]|uniref:Cysteine synthase n=1 Tax=Clostridium cylindrosporum DSM 605 TaxID=1121307 RepID=A0A0J8D3S8_CLOCY|nr:cysteine synthase A [Clostridium cylindrosporum]KMT20825.1 cysteine synthase CysK [Clostridium cylindrosporum DSM 605]
MIYDNIYGLIGNTPLVRLNNITDEDMADILVKVEFFNPGGSVKDRIALAMIEEAEKSGLLKKGQTIVEPTSGNTGIGLAMVGAAKGYRVIFTMPETMSMERRRLMKAFGAEIVLTEGSKGMKGAIEMAEKLTKENGYYMPQQFENPANPKAHIENTSLEILKDTDGKVDMFIAGVGTGGTVTGVGKVLKENIKDVKIVAVEPYDSSVLSGNQPGPHKLQGIGAGFVPKILDRNVIDEIECVKTLEAFEAARKVASKEGLLVGISSGAALHVALEKAKELGKGKTIVVLAPDTGERYLSTELFSFE